MVTAENVIYPPLSQLPNSCSGKSDGPTQHQGVAASSLPFPDFSFQSLTHTSAHRLQPAGNSLSSMELSGDSTLGTVVAGEEVLSFLCSPGENSGGDLNNECQMGKAKTYLGHLPPRTSGRNAFEVIIYTLDLVVPRSLPHGDRKTCSSRVVPRLMLVLKNELTQWRQNDTQESARCH